MPEPKPNVPALRGFPAVKKAREALREKALEILEEYRQTIRLAAASGKFAEALEAQKWLLDHIPAEDGQRLVDPSVDKRTESSDGPRGPIIQIGLALGGTEPRKALPPIVEAEVLDE